MILTDRDIEHYIAKGLLRFEPPIQDGQIGTSSIDLRLGTLFSIPRPRKAITINIDHPTDLDYGEIFKEATYTEYVILKKEDYILGQTLERIFMPEDLAARVEGKSSHARLGLTIHNTAPHIHPGWNGTITLEIINHSPFDLRLTPGESFICQVILHKVVNPPELSYGQRPGDIWQNSETPYFPKLNK